MAMLARTTEQRRVRALLRRARVVAILGARQVGKTTLARTIAERATGSVHWFDLESPEDAARLRDPMLALRPLRGLVVLDEVQRLPEVFPVLRVLVDRPRPGVRFLVLGSASPALLSQSSETLAGRIASHELRGFALDEVGVAQSDRLWLRGGFPGAYLARSDTESSAWRRDFIRTFIERDLPGLGRRVAARTIRRFWTMLAHYHGQTWNASAIASSFGVTDHTVRRYLDLLTETFVVRQLQPWHENLGKRQVKSPKVYVADTGLLHTLLGLETRRDVESHPKLGASWESFVIEAVIRRLGARDDECHFWATYAGTELDLLIVRGTQRLGFEIKRTSAPRITRSVHTALHDLGLTRVDVIHAGDATFPLAPRVRAVAARRLLSDLKPLR